MAKIKILGDILQIKSSITQYELEETKRYMPDMLKLKDEEGNEIFRIDVGSASATKYGISFPSTDDEGCLYTTVCMPEANIHDIKMEFGPMVMNLNTVETQIAEAMNALVELEDKLEDMIEVL